MALNIKKWQYLRQGDVVDVIAPGYRASNVDLEAGLEFLRSWNLVPRIQKGIFARDILCSNSDSVRWQHLKKALVAKDSSAIWCLRGGYGSNRLIPELGQLKRPKQKPKLFIGLSDITTLHVYLNQNWGWPTVHGPLLDRLGKKATLPRYESELKKFVFGDLEEISFKKLRPLNSLAMKRQTLKSQVSGGNLIVLQSSLLTKAAWNPKGKILFFEDIGERGYRIDRVLEQFTQAKMFDQAQAIIFGQFTGGLEPDGTTRIPAVIKRFAESVKIPVLKGLASGHDVIQRPLPFGAPAILKLGPHAELTCLSGGERR